MSLYNETTREDWWVEKRSASSTWMKPNCEPGARWTTASPGIPHSSFRQWSPITNSGCYSSSPSMQLHDCHMGWPLLRPSYPTSLQHMLTILTLKFTWVTQDHSVLPLSLPHLQLLRPHTLLCSSSSKVGIPGSISKFLSTPLQILHKESPLCYKTHLAYTIAFTFKYLLSRTLDTPSWLPLDIPTSMLTMLYINKTTCFITLSNSEIFSIESVLREALLFSQPLWNSEQRPQIFFT